MEISLNCQMDTVPGISRTGKKKWNCIQAECQGKNVSREFSDFPREISSFSFSLHIHIFHHHWEFPQFSNSWFGILISFIETLVSHCSEISSLVYKVWIYEGPEGFAFQCLLLFSHWVMSDPLRPHELHHARLPCPSLSPGVCSNSHPLSQWCHRTISSSVAPNTVKFFPLMLPVGKNRISTRAEQRSPTSIRVAHLFLFLLVAIWISVWENVTVSVLAPWWVCQGTTDVKLPKTDYT